MKSQKNWKVLIGLIVTTEAVGLVSGLLAGNNVANYEALNTVPFSPPAYVFGMVWPILYALIAISLYWITQAVETQSTKFKAYLLYGLQLLLNVLWSSLFFGASLRWVAFILMLLLDSVVFIQIRYYAKLSKLASFLLTPYFIWLLFATYLNFGYALVN